MFFMIGADGREYGPFTADQIRDWVAQGRANAHSRIRRDGETAWQALGEMPEFAGAAAGGPAADQRQAPPMLTADAIAREYLARNVTVDIGSCISRGWALVRDNPGLTMGSTLLIWVVTLALAMIPLIGLAVIFVGPVLMGGLYYVFIRRIRGETPEIADAFAGINLAFLQLGLAGVVTALLIAVGMALCILPGVYLAVAYVFARPLVIDKKLEFWTAMEVSRRVVNRQWWTIFGLGIILVLMLCAGALLCLIGLILAGPVSVAALMYAYEDLFGGPAVTPAIVTE
jgi:uncharacterized membrane protein